MKARIGGLLILALAATAFVLLSSISNLMHWTVLATAFVLIAVGAYGLMCVLTNRWGP